MEEFINNKQYLYPISPVNSGKLQVQVRFLSS